MRILPNRIMSTCAMLLFTLAACGTTAHLAHSASEQIAFSQNALGASCDTHAPAGASCLAVTGQGTTVQFGMVTFQRIATLANPTSSTACAPAMTTGHLIVTQADTVAFQGNGMWCPRDGSATYKVTIAGGTGTFLKATGQGTISVPSATIGGENWSISFAW